MSICSMRQEILNSGCINKLALPVSYLTNRHWWKTMCISETHRDVLKYAIKVVKNALFILQIRLELSPMLHEL